MFILQAITVLLCYLPVTFYIPNSNHDNLNIKKEKKRIFKLAAVRYYPNKTYLSLLKHSVLAEISKYRTL